jgi:uncharacterized membrane protein YjjP (DUF1212 family)
MNYELLVNTAVLAGEIMLSGGAETYRVEDTIIRILKMSGLAVTETVATTTGINVTLSDPSINTITYIKRVSIRNTNLERIYEVNEVSRRFCSQQMTLEEANQRLHSIRNMQTYRRYIIYLCMVMTAAFFTVLYGGNEVDFAIGALNGGILALFSFLFSKVRVNLFIHNMVSALLVTISSALFLRYFPTSIHITILLSGSITPLVPGVAITNAIRDTFQGDYMSGGARAIEAFVAATAISVGVGVGLALFRVYALI